jgi:hypothetical protein
MRVWFVPTPVDSEVTVAADSPLAQQAYVKENDGKIYVGQDTVADLPGGCNLGSMCTYDKTDPEKLSDCANSCSGDDGNLVHEWTAISPDTIGPLSAVCYIAIRNVKVCARTAWVWDCAPAGLRVETAE